MLIAMLLPPLVAGGYLAERGEVDESTTSVEAPAPARTPQVVEPFGVDAASGDHEAEATEPERSYVYPVRGCPTSYARTHHHYPAADIFGNGHCVFVAPVSGRIEHVSLADRWDPATNVGAARGGLSVALVGADGVRYYGSHLAEVLRGVRPGLRVQAGQPLGVLGDSGSAKGTGTHLHFGISWPSEPGSWWLRRGVVRPQPYLNAWRAGGDTSPAEEVAAARRDYGDDSRLQQLLLTAPRAAPLRDAGDRPAWLPPRRPDSNSLRCCSPRGRGSSVKAVHAVEPVCR